MREIHDVNEYMRSLVRALWCGVRGRREARRRPRSKTDGSVRRSKTKKIVAVDRIVREVRLFDRESRAFLRFFVRSFVRGRVMDRLCGDFLELVVDVGVFGGFFIRRRRRRRRARRQRRSHVLLDDVRGPRSNVDGFDVVLVLSKSGERRRCAWLELKRDVVGFAERIQTRVSEFLHLDVPSEFSLAHAQTRASVRRGRHRIVRSRTTRATLIVERAGGCCIEERVAMRLRAHV